MTRSVFVPSALSVVYNFKISELRFVWDLELEIWDFARWRLRFRPRNRMKIKSHHPGDDGS
jgi:hypothetical protein